jgi:hypothetical protein
LGAFIAYKVEVKKKIYDGCEKMVFEHVFQQQAIPTENMLTRRNDGLRSNLTPAQVA